MMCNGTGIDTVAVTSFEHEWNKIKLENSWYNVDCTWDDNGSDNVGYTYFLRNDDYYDTSSSYSKKHHAEEAIGKDICLQQKWIVLAVHGYL